MTSQQIFVSYAAADKAAAETICNALETSGWKCWMAPRDIKPGSDWSETIIDAINDSELMILIYSESSGASIQIKREVECASNKNIPVVTFRIEDVSMSKSLEYYLLTTYWIDALMPRLELHLRLLKDVVEKLIGIPSADASPPREAPAERHPAREIGRKNIKRKSFLSRNRSARMTVIAALLIIFIGAAAYLGIARPWSDQGTFDTHRNQCQAFLNQGEFDKAIDEANKAIAKEPANPLGHRALGVAYFARGSARQDLTDMPRAIEAFSNSLKFNPQDDYTLFMRGQAYNVQGEFSRGADDFSTALKLHIINDQRKAEVYYNRASSSFGMKNYDLALADFRSANELFKDGANYYGIGKALFELGDYREAIKNFTEGMSTNSASPILYQERSKAYSKLHMDSEAAKDAQTYFELSQPKK